MAATESKPRQRIVDEHEPHDMPLAPTATAARAGSLEKILVMRERVEQGYRPFHPNDNPLVELQVFNRSIKP